MASISAAAGSRSAPKRIVQKISDGRHAALAVLLVLEQGNQVQAVLDKYLRTASLKPQDRALCTELVYGFLRAEIRIEHLLLGLLRNPQKLPREMYLALGLAVYALLFLERIPPHATVDWTVGHVRSRFGEALSRVANGALRTFVRLGDAPKQQAYYAREGAGPAAAVYAEALFYSLPAWVVKLWGVAYGAEARVALCQRALRAPYTGVRVNALSPHAAEVYTALVTAKSTARSVDTAVAVEHSGQPVGFSGVAFAAGQSPRSVANAPLSYWQQQGDISFQSSGSQCVMQALNPQSWPGPIWDICAGQGGKTAILLEQGLNVALCTDVHVDRLKSFTGNIRRFASAFLPLPAGDDGPDVADGAADVTEYTSAMPHAMSADTAAGSDDTAAENAENPEACALAGIALPPFASVLAGAQKRAACAAHERQQALAVLKTVETALGAEVSLFDYPPLQKPARTVSASAHDSHDSSDDYDEYDAMSEPDEAEYDNYDCEELEVEACAGLDATFSAAAVAASKDLGLPLVALMDACTAPPNSWAGTICIDAPCSGLGILSRRPDIRRHRSADSLPEVIALQARMIDAAWQALQVGGGLVYMTCTLNPAENEGQIQRLLTKYPQARLVHQWQTEHQHPWLEGMFGAYCIKE